MHVEIPVSVGELFDKISILELKIDHVVEYRQKDNIQKELKYLKNKAVVYRDVDIKLVDDLASVNRFIWSIEDRIRRLESEQRFDSEFISLARMIYMCNDMRAALKRRINDQSNSSIVEEKIY